MTDLVTAKRKDLWQAMHTFIRENGGVVTSPPDAKVVRAEIPKESALPVKLRELGYQPIHCGATMRVTSNGLKATDIVEIVLGK